MTVFEVILAIIACSILVIVSVCVLTLLVGMTINCVKGWVKKDDRIKTVSVLWWRSICE